MSALHFFLGANSGEGFASLYDGLTGGRVGELAILKGGPGCGKSTLMRRLAEAEEARGGRVVFIHCSGDPASLDGAVFPDRSAAVVDGTAPHVLEPVYALACERYVDLSHCCDRAAAKARRAALIAHTDAYRAQYREAYALLRAVAASTAERRALLREGFDQPLLLRRVDAILSQVLPEGDGSGARVDRAFLGGVTHLGDLCRFDTADALCPCVYALRDSAGLGAAALAHICRTARSRGLFVLACPDPDRPRALQHVLLPSCGVAFVTTNARIPYPGKPVRTLHPDAQATARLTRAQRAQLRLLRRVEDSLRADAVAALARAKSAHDALEACYRPCVDFSAVSAVAEEELSHLLG